MIELMKYISFCFCSILELVCNQFDYLYYFHKFSQEIMTFLTGNFDKKNPPIWLFCPQVQLDQNAILDKSIWTQLF